MLCAAIEEATLRGESITTLHVVDVKKNVEQYIISEEIAIG